MDDWKYWGLWFLAWILWWWFVPIWIGKVVRAVAFEWHRAKAIIEAAHPQFQAAVEKEMGKGEMSNG